MTEVICTCTCSYDMNRLVLLFLRYQAALDLKLQEQAQRWVRFKTLIGNQNQELDPAEKT